jgi:hypothetical protein
MIWMQMILDIVMIIAIWILYVVYDKIAESVYNLGQIIGKRKE